MALGTVTPLPGVEWPPKSEASESKKKQKKRERKKSKKRSKESERTPRTEEIDRLIAARMRQLRNSRKLSVTKAAKGVGVSPFVLRSWEVGTQTTDFDGLNAIASFYGVTVDFLFGRARR